MMKQNKSLHCFHTPSKQGVQLKPSTYSQWSLVFFFVQTFPSEHQPAWTADVGERLFYPVGEEANDWSGSLWESKKRGHTCVWARSPGRQEMWIAFCQRGWHQALTGQLCLLWWLYITHQSPSDHSQWAYVHMEGCELQPGQCGDRSSCAASGVEAVTSSGGYSWELERLLQQSPWALKMEKSVPWKVGLEKYLLQLLLVAWPYLPTRCYWYNGKVRSINREADRQNIAIGKS